MKRRKHVKKVPVCKITTKCIIIFYKSQLTLHRWLKKGISKLMILYSEVNEREFYHEFVSKEFPYKFEITIYFHIAVDKLATISNSR